MLRSLFSLLPALLFIGCEGDGTSSSDTGAEKEKLMETSREWSKAAEAGDTSRILSYWTEDAIVVSPGEPIFNGKQDIRRMVGGSFSNPAFRISWKPQSGEVSKSGDLGYLVEKTKMIVGDSAGVPVEMHFNTITIWKKQEDGSWKAVVDAMIPAPAN